MANKYAHLREKARELRQKGYTLTEIMDFLKMPKTTVYGWIEDIEVDIKHYRPKHDPQYSDAKRERDRKNSERYAVKRDAAYKQGLKEAPELFKNPLFRDFVVLYIAEGLKRDRNVVEVANSDSAAIVLSQYWILRFRNQAGKIHYRLQMHVDQDETEVKHYWAEKLNIPVEQISTIRKSNSGQLSGRKFRSEYGVLSIRVGDTYFRARLEAWLDYLKKQWVDLNPE